MVEALGREKMSGFRALVALGAYALFMGLVCSVEAHEEHMEVAHKTITLKDICANRQVPIVDIRVARRLIREIRMDPTDCPESYRQSFYELEPILSINTDTMICSEKKFNQIAEYHFRYINPKQEVYKFGEYGNLDKPEMVVKKQDLHEEKFDYKVQLDDYKQEIMIPIAMQQFFKAWALQVTGLCKRAIVENLPRAVQNHLSEEDMELIESVAEYIDLEKQEAINPLTKAPLGKLNFDQMVFMPELEGYETPADLELHNQLIHLDLRKDPTLNGLMHACKLRFKPIYSKLIIPVVRMAKLGYDYQGPHMDKINDKFSKDEEVVTWLGLTAICEAQGRYELVETPGKPVEMEQVKYDPMINHDIDGDLWIKGAEALSKEFQRIRGANSTGLQKFFFDLATNSRKAIALIDPHQSAWYRRNQNTLSSALNIASIVSNGVGIAVTLSSG